MSEEQQITNEQGQAPAVAENTDNAHMIPKSRFDEVNSRYKEMADKLAQIEAERKQAEEERLAKQNEWQQLAEKRQAEIDRLSGYEERVTEMVKQAEEQNAKLIESVPEDKRRLIPSDYDPLKLQMWLSNNRDLLTATYTPPSTNGGAGTYQRPTAAAKPLSPKEIEVARKMGVDPEIYAKKKAALKGN